MGQVLARIGSLWIDGPLSWLERASIKSFIELGHDYVLYTYGTVSNVPDGAEVRDAREVWANDNIIIHSKAKSPAIHADVFRAIMVRDTGRVWADTDIIALKPFRADLEWFFGWERSDRPVLGNAIMGFPSNSQMIRELTDFLTSDFPIPPWFNKNARAAMQAKKDAGETLNLGDLPWGTTGPQALTYFSKKTGEIEHAQPQSVFFPISFPERKSLTDPKQIGTTKVAIEDSGSLCVHLYSRWIRKFLKGNPGTFPSRTSWLGDHLATRDLIDYDSIPPSELKTKNKGNKGSNKIPPIDREDFYEDLAKRKQKLPNGEVTSRHGKVVCVTMAKDEGPYILEWVAYHHLKGFTDILAFTNDCTDGTDEMLDALAEFGLVTRMDNGPMGTKPPQSRALQRAQAHPLVKDADWVMVMDFDEFLSVRAGDGTVNPLIDIVKEKGATAMSITWRFFGSGGIAKYEDKPVTQRLTKAASDMFTKGFGIKTLFKQADHLRLAIHRPRIIRKKNLEGQHELNWVNGSGRPVDGKVMTWRQTRETAGYDFAQLNHYGVKTAEEYLMRRLRGDVLNNNEKYDDAYFSQFDRNEIDDKTATVNAEEVNSLISALLKKKSIRDADVLIKERFAQKLEKLRNSKEYPAQMKSLGFDGLN